MTYQFGKGIVLACAVFAVGVAMQTAAEHAALFVGCLLDNAPMTLNILPRLLVVFLPASASVSFLAWFHCINLNGECDRSHGFGALTLLVRQSGFVEL